MKLLLPFALLFGAALGLAYVIMVALDENERPTEVPGLICETEEEEREYLEGKFRSEMRKKKKISNII